MHCYVVIYAYHSGIVFFDLIKVHLDTLRPNGILREWYELREVLKLLTMMTQGLGE